MKKATPQEHRYAVVCLARYRARKLVEARLKEQGRRVSLVRPAEIRALAEAELLLNQVSLIMEAEQTIKTSRQFARWRLEPPK
jgi:hypothetical protein